MCMTVSQAGFLGVIEMNRRPFFSFSYDCTPFPPFIVTGACLSQHADDEGWSVSVPQRGDGR